MVQHDSLMVQARTIWSRKYQTWLIQPLSWMALIFVGPIFEICGAIAMPGCIFHPCLPLLNPRWGVKQALAQLCESYMPHQTTSTIFKSGYSIVENYCWIGIQYLVSKVSKILERIWPDFGTSSRSEPLRDPPRIWPWSLWSLTQPPRRSRPKELVKYVLQDMAWKFQS